MNKLLLIVLAAPLTLAACNPNPVVVPVHTQPSTVNGTLSGYSGAVGTVELLSDDSAGKSASNPVLASTTLNSNGTFTLPLPSAAAVVPYLSSGTSAITPSLPGCTGGLTNSAPASQSFVFSSLRANDNFIESAEGSQTSTALTVHGKLWIYETQATTLGGALNCTSANGSQTEIINFTANAPLRTGWNVLALDANGAVSGSTITLNLALTTLDDAPSVWYAGDNLGGLSLKNSTSSTTFKTGLDLVKTALRLH